MICRPLIKEIHDPLRIDRAADGAGLGLEQRRGAGDDDRFCEGTTTSAMSSVALSFTASVMPDCT